MSGPQGRHDVVASHVLWAWRNSAQLSEAGPHHGRRAQQHVLWGVYFFPADRAEGFGAALVLAPLARSGGGLSDPVSPLGLAGPVAGPQLVHVDCLYFLRRQGGGGASLSVAGTIRPARLKGNVWSGPRLSRRRPVNGSDVHRCVRLVAGAGLLGDVIVSLVALEAAVGRHPLEVNLPTAFPQPR